MYQCVLGMVCSDQQFGAWECHRQCFIIFLKKKTPKNVISVNKYESRETLSLNSETSENELRMLRLSQIREILEIWQNGRTSVVGWGVPNFEKPSPECWKTFRLTQEHLKTTPGTQTTLAYASYQLNRDVPSVIISAPKVIYPSISMLTFNHAPPCLLVFNDEDWVKIITKRGNCPPNWCLIERTLCGRFNELVVIKIGSITIEIGPFQIQRLVAGFCTMFGPIKKHRYM